jgi:hypothetical protein
LAQASNNNCRRCNAELSAGNLEAWDAAAFQAWLDELEPDSEEERQQGSYDVRPHPQRDVTVQAWAVGDWRLELRRQEQIWWINHGPQGLPSDGDGSSAAVRPEGFRMCPSCGEIVRQVVQPVAPEAPRRGRKPARDPRADQDPHAKRCNGEPRAVALGQQTKADTLRLIVDGLEEQGEDGVAWAWSVGTALLEGARKYFELDDDDLDVIVQTARDGDGKNRALEILWVDKILGGSGIIEALVREFQKVAGAAVRHLDGHDCHASCYRCLRNYRNQRVHGVLNWRLAMPYLQAAAVSDVEPLAPATRSTQGEGPEWDEARKEGCESPLELCLLKAIRAAGLPEPLKQHEVYNSRGRLITRSDFAYTMPKRILIYADGLAFHSALRQRIHDTRQSNQLQIEGWQVLRFLGPQVYRDADDCVANIRSALSESSSGRF